MNNANLFRIHWWIFNYWFVRSTRSEIHLFNGRFFKKVISEWWDKFLSVYISLPKDTGSKKIYGYKFLEKQTCSSKDALGLVMC